MIDANKWLLIKRFTVIGIYIRILKYYIWLLFVEWVDWNFEFFKRNGICPNGNDVWEYKDDMKEVE